MGFERSEEYYDVRLPAKVIPESWIKMYWVVFGLVAPYLNNKIAELGCGPGAFSKILYHQGVKDYFGIDFSQRCLDIASKGVYDGDPVLLVDDFGRTHYFRFGKYNLVKDNETLKPMLKDYDVFVLIEVLEHITEDFKVLDLIPSGQIVVLTGPNTSDEAHVRFFYSLNDFVLRYEKLINFDFIGQLATGTGKEFYITRGIKR